MGLLDEVTVYESALTDREIREPYNSQNAWVEEREEVGFIVSTDPPTVTLSIADGTYLPAAMTAVLIETASDYALAVKTDLLIAGTTHTPGGTILYAAPGTAWMAPFVPVYGEGEYVIDVMVEDDAGNCSISAEIGQVQALSASQTVLIDTTAPSSTIDMAVVQLFTPSRYLISI